MTIEEFLRFGAILFPIMGAVCIFALLFIGSSRDAGANRYTQARLFELERVQIEETVWREFNEEKQRRDGPPMAYEELSAEDSALLDQVRQRVQGERNARTLRRAQELHRMGVS